MMHALLKNELYKVLRSNKICFSMMIALVVEIAIALRVKLGGGLSGAPVINGQSFPLLLFDDLPHLMVVFVAAFIADIWVEEYKSGALKMTLLRPVNRSHLLNAKVASLFCCSAVIIGFVLLSSYIVGTIAFGWGDITVIRDTEYAVIGNAQYSPLTGIILTLEAGAVTLFPVLGFGLLVMFLALCTDSLGMTIGGGLGFMIASKAITRKYSLFYLMRAFYKNLLFGSLQSTVLENVTVIALYAAVFYTGSRLLFGSKDLLA